MLYASSLSRSLGCLGAERSKRAVAPRRSARLTATATRQTRLGAARSLAEDIHRGKRLITRWRKAADDPNHPYTKETGKLLINAPERVFYGAIR